MENDNIQLESTFNIKSDIETTKEYISKTVTFQPNVEYDINMINDFEYQIVPKANLNSNSIYNVVYDYEKGKYKWSFQTEKIYDVSGVYPINEAMNVDTATVIEMNFSYKPNDDIEKYFQIVPNVSGKFEVDERKITFIPKEKLKNSTKYEFTIKKGFGNKENDDLMQNDITSVFYTTYEKYNKDPVMIDNVFSFKKGDDIKIPIISSYTRDITDMKIQIYKYNNEDEFVSGITNQMRVLSYNSLCQISTVGLKKIYDAKYLASELSDGINGYDKVLQIDKQLEEGYYLAVIQENDMSHYINIQINNMMGYVTYFDDKAVVWINSVENNKVVENATIYRNGEYLGKTNSDGYIEVNNFKRQIGNYNSEYIKVEKDNKKPLYMFFTDWYNDDQYTYNDQNLNVYAFTDREKYKQGETVNLWGYIKHRNNIEFNNINIELCYSDYASVLETKQVNLDDFGAFSSSFDLTAYDNGYYYFKIYANGHVLMYKYFEIRDYATKNYNVEAKLDKDVIFAGEDLQLDVSVTLFDGTPIADTEFKYSYFYGENRKTGTFKTDDNGVATIKLDTTYNTIYSSYVYANLQIWNEGKEAEYETKYLEFIVLPKQENYMLECKFDKNRNTYTFDATSYLYDKNALNYIGEYTDREIAIKVDKFYKKQVLDYTYYNENTKTNEEVYKTVKEYIGTDNLILKTQNGKAIIEYPNPISLEVDGYITFSSTMEMRNKEVITNNSYTYIEGLYNYNDNVEYQVNYDYGKSYKIGETINIEVIKNNEKITENLNFLHIIKSVKGTEVVYTQSPKYTMVFSKEYGTDIIVKTYVFDGTGIYPANWYGDYPTYSLDKSELKLDIDISFDKASYKPGEEATINIITKYKGNPVEASINICAVDNSYLAYYANTVDIVNSLYNYYYFNNNNDFVSHEVWNNLSGGEGGGGEEERSKFDTTAFFENVKTDIDGKATIKVTWPDNITTWSILAQGISKEYKAGQSLREISVTLPFFVTAIYEDTYLVNEEPNINIRSNGVSVRNGEEVQYNVIITMPDGTTKEGSVSSTVGQYVQYPLPSLLPGIYEIKIYGKCKEYSDTVIHKFDVEESVLNTMQLRILNVEKGDYININSNIARIYLYNTSTEKIINELIDLSNLPKLRNDQIVISKLAKQMLTDLSGGKYVSNSESVFFSEEGIEIMKNASKDTVLTAKILSAGYTNVYRDGMVKFFDRKLDDSKIDIREKLFALWGLASLKQPVLQILNDMNNQIENEGVLEKAILGLAYVDIGDYEKANILLNEILPIIDSNNEEEFEYITTLAIKLNDVNAERLYNEYLNLNRESEYRNFVKLFYVQNSILNDAKKASLLLNINGREKEYNLEKIAVEILEITQKDKVYIEDIDKNVSMKIEHYITIDKTINNNIIKKEYYVDGKKTNTFKVGDIVVTRIYIDYDKLSEDIQYFTIEDILPNCMVYLQNNVYDYYNSNVITQPIDVRGNKFVFNVSLYNKKNPYIEYKSRVISNGHYVSDGTILKTYNNIIHDYISAGNIEVK